MSQEALKWAHVDVKKLQEEETKIGVKYFHIILHLQIRVFFPIPQGMSSLWGEDLDFPGIGFDRLCIKQQTCSPFIKGQLCVPYPWYCVQPWKSWRLPTHKYPRAKKGLYYGIFHDGVRWYRGIYIQLFPEFQKPPKCALDIQKDEAWHFGTKKHEAVMHVSCRYFYFAFQGLYELPSYIKRG